MTGLLVGNGAHGQWSFGNQSSRGPRFTMPNRPSHGSGRYRSANGDQYQGQYNRRGGLQAGGSYRSTDGTMYSGGFRRRPGQTTVSGSYHTPGVLPGTQDRYSGDLNFQGRNSSAQGRYELYDATGGHRLAGATANLDRRGYQQSGKVGFGGLTGRQSQSIDFRGANSNVSWNQDANLGGAAGFGAGVRGNRGGITGGANVKVGGLRVGGEASVSKSGIKANISGPKITKPTIKMPTVKKPTIRVPTVKKPTIKVPTPKISVPAPSISVPSFDTSSVPW
jgi:hypothetical protein